MGNNFKNSFFDMCCFIDVYQISKWTFWSQNVHLDIQNVHLDNVGTSYTDKAFQAMGSSRAKFLDLKSTVAKGFMHNTQGVHEFAWENILFHFLLNFS